MKVECGGIVTKCDTLIRFYVLTFSLHSYTFPLRMLADIRRDPTEKRTAVASPSPLGCPAVLHGHTEAADV